MADFDARPTGPVAGGLTGGPSRQAAAGPGPDDVVAGSLTGPGQGAFRNGGRVPLVSRRGRSALAGNRQNAPVGRERAAERFRLAQGRALGLERAVVNRQIVRAGLGFGRLLPVPRRKRGVGR